MCLLFFKKSLVQFPLFASPPSFLPPPNKRAFFSSSLSACVVSPDVPGQGGGGADPATQKTVSRPRPLFSLVLVPPPGGLIYRQRGKTERRTGGGAIRGQERGEML